MNEEEARPVPVDRHGACFLLPWGTVKVEFSRLSDLTMLTVSGLLRLPQPCTALNDTNTIWPYRLIVSTLLPMAASCLQALYQ
jgi:hypothetical protein